MTFLNLIELEALARERLPRMTADYFAGGAADEITVRENRLSWSAPTLRYRVLVDVSQRDLSCTILGRNRESPIFVAPMAFQRLAHPDGELATVRAAARSRATMIVSTLSTVPMEDVRAATTDPIWFQLYIHKDRGITSELVRRAEAAGFEALVLTVDVPAQARRERDIRNGFHLPTDIPIANLSNAGIEHFPAIRDDSALASYVMGNFDPSLTWRDLEQLSQSTSMPVVVKGIVRGDDAKLAVSHGARAIVVSNHGGRQLDTSITGLEALPDVVAAVDAKLDVLVDGGIRRGTDIVKAIALGAKAVLVGRPVLWGLAIDGENGATRVLDLLREELDTAMALCGAPSLANITPDLIA